MKTATERDASFSRAKETILDAAMTRAQAEQIRDGLRPADLVDETKWDRLLAALPISPNGAEAIDEPERSLIVSWDEFMAETETFGTSLWGDALIVPGGAYTILGGPGGVGKTILWTNLIFALATGQAEFLGFPLPGRSVRVFLAEAEGSRARFRERLRAVAATLGHSLEDLPIVFPSKEAKLWISDEDFPRMIEQSRAEFALLDPVTAFHDGEDNSNTDWRRHVRGPAAEMAKAMGVAFGFSDHYGKPATKLTEQKQGRHKLIGASAKFNDAGAAMRMEIGQGGKASRILIFDRARDGGLPDPDKIALTIDIKAGTIERDERAGDEIFAYSDSRVDDLKSLFTSNTIGPELQRGALEVAIKLHLGLERSRAGDLIKSAMSAGVLEQTRERGPYRLTGRLFTQEPQ